MKIVIAVIFTWGLVSCSNHVSKCHGQCATGNSTERHDCKKMCDKLTVCPTYGAE